jgi:hypothetical protein
MTYDYVKSLLVADKDVPYRTCTICKTPMVFTMRQWFPHIISCKCHADGSRPLVRLTWDELREILEKKP